MGSIVEFDVLPEIPVVVGSEVAKSLLKSESGVVRGLLGEHEQQGHDINQP